MKGQWLWTVLVVIATLYVAFEVPKWIERFRPGGPSSRIANHRDIAVQKIYGLSNGPYSDADFQHATEQLLFAAQLEIEQATGA
jgi:hypothetical protein